MPAEQLKRVLILEEGEIVTPDLLTTIEKRASQGPAQFRIVVTNPAAAEIHLLHPERHQKAAEAELTLHAALPQIEAAAGGTVIGTVSVRHDPMDAVEDVLFNEPIDEIILSVTTHDCPLAAPGPPAPTAPPRTARDDHRSGGPV